MSIEGDLRDADRCLEVLENEIILENSFQEIRDAYESFKEEYEEWLKGDIKGLVAEVDDLRDRPTVDEVFHLEGRIEELEAELKDSQEGCEELEGELDTANDYIARLED